MKRPIPVVDGAGYTAHIVAPGLWHVTNPEGVVYTVRPAEASCSCPAFRTCRHIKLVWGLEGLMPEAAG